MVTPRTSDHLSRNLVFAYLFTAPTTAHTVLVGGSGVDPDSPGYEPGDLPSVPPPEALYHLIPNVFELRHYLGQDIAPMY